MVAARYGLLSVPAILGSAGSYPAGAAMLTFGHADMERSIGPTTLAHGRIVHAQGKVLDFDVNAGGTVIVGRVRGSAPRPYQQMITLRPDQQGVIIQGACSCL